MPFLNLTFSTNPDNDQTVEYEEHSVNMDASAGASSGLCIATPSQPSREAPQSLNGLARANIGNVAVL